MWMRIGENPWRDLAEKQLWAEKNSVPWSLQSLKDETSFWRMWSLEWMDSIGSQAMIRKIPDDVQAEIDARVASGQYADEESVLREGVELLRKRDALVERLQESRRQLDSGEVAEFDDASLAARFAELKSKAAEASRSDP
jgi:Arc/MetJ-type ribon-helix-helix transcriptional regulator